MDLSVVVPVLDVGEVLVAQLDALARQQWDGAWEVVLADNGSTDGRTLAIAESYAAVDPRFRVVDASARRGRSAALNAGVLAARAEHIAVCDGDDVVASDWVSQMATALARARFVCGPLDYTRLNPPWAVQARGGGPDQVHGPLTITGGPPWPFALGANVGVHRSDHLAVGGYDEHFTYGGEDCDYAWRLRRHGVELTWVPDMLVHYRARRRLRDIYRQARAYSAPHLTLQSRWGHVWPVPPTPPSPRQRTRRILRSLPRARSRGGIGHVVWDAGWNAGYARGAGLPQVDPLPASSVGPSLDSAVDDGRL